MNVLNWLLMLTFFKTSLFVFHQRKEVTQVWNDMSVIKWWQNFHLSWRWTTLLICKTYWKVWILCSQMVSNVLNSFQGFEQGLRQIAPWLRCVQISSAVIVRAEDLSVGQVMSGTPPGFLVIKLLQTRPLRCKTVLTTPCSQNTLFGFHEDALSALALDITVCTVGSFLRDGV